LDEVREMFPREAGLGDYRPVPGRPRFEELHVTPRLRKGVRAGGERRGVGRRRRLIQRRGRRRIDGDGDGNDDDDDDVVVVVVVMFVMTMRTKI
jgi:hypothetical protein